MLKLLKFKSAISRAIIAGSALVATVALPTAANATAEVGSSATVSPCTNFSFNVAITACAGGYSGNLLQDSLTSSTGLAALAALGGPASGNYLEPKLSPLSSSDGIINFGTLLTGLTIFGMHAGGAGDGGQGTFFFLFDAGAGVDIIRITDRLNSNSTGLSNAALFRTGVPSVPEPATWAMMLLGFGGMGAALRKSRKPTLQVA